MDQSQDIRRTMGREVTRSPRAEAKHYRAPESYPLVPAPSARSNNTELLLMAQQDTLHRIHTGGTTVARTHTNIICTTTTLARNNAPSVEDGHQYQKGYNCKADVYSLMMIYYEMLAESKPFGNNIITREGHYYRVQSHGLRPSLNKHHFPRTIKSVLEGGWNPVIGERSSAAQIRQLLTTILPMLEGKGLPLREKKAPSKATLPARAASLLVPHGQDNGWNSVWSRTRTTRKLDSNQVMATIQAHRVGKAKEKDAMGNNIANSNEQKQKSTKKSKQTMRSRSLKDYLPTFKTGMVKTPMNDRTSKALLGDAAYYDKKQRQASTEAFKKAYY